MGGAVFKQLPEHNAKRSPRSTERMIERGAVPTNPDRSSLSTVTIWQPRATQAVGNPVEAAGRTTLPIALPRARLDVSGTTITVRSLLSVSKSS